MLHVILTHTFLHREEGNSSHITDTAYWLVRPLYNVYSLIAEATSPLENSSSTGIELMNMPSHTAVYDNLSIVITVVCIHWVYIRRSLLAPLIKNVKMSDKFPKF